MIKQYLVTTASADKRVYSQKVCEIYYEETLLNSDYKNFIPKKLYETTIQIEKVLGIASTALAKKGEYIEWVTTITRIA